MEVYSRYALAVLAVGLFWLARLAFQPWLGLSVPYLHFSQRF